MLAGKPSGRAEECTQTATPGSDLASVIGRIPPSSGPVTLCLGAGEFRLRRFVSIQRGNFRLRGRGSSTVVRLDAGTESPVIVIGDHANKVPTRTTSNVTIESLRVVGGGRGGSEFEREHPYLTNSAVVVRTGRQVTIRNLHLSACRSACILTEYGSEEVTIEDNDVSEAVWDGISLNRTSKARIVGNRIHDNNGAGITTEHLEDSVVENNTVSDNKTHGVYLSDSYHNTFVTNRFSRNVLSGVLLTCAVRDHEPSRCWDDSMSRGNIFDGNEFLDNRVGYMVAADAAANCTAPGFQTNLSRRDHVVPNRNQEADWTIYGRCIRYEAPR